MIVQIYEIQSPHEAEICIEAGVDHIGSVLLSETEWKLPELRETINLSDGTNVKNSIIPLFQDIDVISRSIDYYQPDFIHFCETLTDDEGMEADLEPYINIQTEIKKRYPGVGIIRSIPVPLKGMTLDFPTLNIARVFELISDLFLTDTWLAKEPVKGFIGITGKMCDPKIARDLVIQSAIPVILAGGLSPENVYEAVTNIIPAGADSCTLTNRLDNDGKPIRFQKDFEKVKRFVHETRRAESVLIKKRELLGMEITELRELLKDRLAALPAHSISPHQIQVIEDLEDKIAEREEMLSGLI